MTTILIATTVALLAGTTLAIAETTRISFQVARQKSKSLCRQSKHGKQL